MTLLYRIGLFAGHDAPRAFLLLSLRKSDENGITVKATWVHILLPLTGAGIRQDSILTSGCHQLAYVHGHRHPSKPLQKFPHRRGWRFAVDPDNDLIQGSNASGLRINFQQYPSIELGIVLVLLNQVAGTFAINEGF